MTDLRSARKTNIIQFISKLEKDCSTNFAALIQKAKKLELEGLENIIWSDHIWKITGGRLSKQTGTNAECVSINFHYSPKLGGKPIKEEWADLLKSLFLLRFHRKNQSLPNQRNFITAIGYIVYFALKRNCQISRLTPEYLDEACRLISLHYSKGAAYNLHKAISEFCAYCDGNKLCKVNLDYKFSGMKRPDNVGGLNHKRLDDPEVLQTKSDKLITPEVFKIIAELYQNVPKDHKYRFYVLVLTLLTCLGRRFSEISLMPFQYLQRDGEGRFFLEYFPRKASLGDTFTPRRRLYLPASVIEVVEPVLKEINEICTPARTTADKIQKTKQADLSFLSEIPENKRLYKEDLEKLNISSTTLSTTGWIRVNGYAFPDHHKMTSQGKKSKAPFYYTTRKGVEAYCQKDFSNRFVAPIHIDQNNQKFYLKDLLLVRYMGLSSGTYSRWIATQCTHSMLTTFLRYLPDLATEYASSSINLDFTSHHFRHTLNTLLDEGGLSDLLQTEWFGRRNPRDTKAYQHTSREKRALMLREDIKKGQVGGKIAEQLKFLPINAQDAYLKARINAVHDVGTGLCVHNFSQTPCERHLQCSADCKDYVWVKGDKGRAEELKRQFAITLVARETAEKTAQSVNPKKSIDWMAHNNKKLSTLSKQLSDNEITDFNPQEYLEELKNEQTF